MESANEAATQLKQLRDLLLGRNPPVKKRCYRHQTQNSHLFCDSQWKFSPSFSAVYVDRRDGHERDGHNGDFQKVQPAHGHRTDVQVRAPFFFFLGFCQANQRATLLITSSPFSKHEPSLSELEQLLCTCNGFVYLAKERFTAKIPPVKLVALNLSGTEQANNKIFIIDNCCYFRSCFCFGHSM